MTFELNYWNAVNLLHILFVAPLLAYVGLNGKNTEEWVFRLLMYTGIFVFAYHLWRFTQNTSEYGRMINLFHIAIVAPLLFFVGFYGENTLPLFYNILFLLSIIVLFYHAYSLYQRFM